jgi:hypothetical protein
MVVIKLLSVKPSTKAEKKLMATFDVDGKERVVHFGSAKNKDFTIYYKTEGKEKAEKMKAAYLARHKVNENWNNPLTAGSLSRWILWNLPTVSASIKDFKKRFSL